MAKVVQTDELFAGFGAEMEKAPALAGAFLLSGLIVRDGGELVGHADVVGGIGVRVFWGLTCDFAEVFEEVIFADDGNGVYEDSSKRDECMGLLSPVEICCSSNVLPLS